MSKQFQTSTEPNSAALRYPWLPAWDEANVHNVWVPTPEEIAAEVAKLREDHNRRPRHRNALGNDSRFRVPCRKRGMQ